MPPTATTPPLAGVLERLREDPEALPWHDRRALAASLANLLAGERDGEAQTLLVLLSEDPRPEVRKEVADLLVLLPEVDCARLAARLSEDVSGFVRKAVERSLDRKRRGRQETERHRLGLDHVEAKVASIARLHGTLAAAKARKLADLQFDTLVGAIVHDLRSFLNSLKGEVAMLRARLKDGGIDQRTLREGLPKMAERLSLLERFVEDMRAYAQATPPTSERRRERIADLVSSALSAVRDELKGRRYKTSAVALDVAVPERLTADVARHQTVAAIAHVLKNAYEALATWPGRKEVTVRAEAQGDDIGIIVSDTGPGMSRDDLDTIRAFVPGRKTNKRRGTGFGLPTARRYAVAHGGSLSIESEEGSGTTVRITIPKECGGYDDEAESAGH